MPDHVTHHYFGQRVLAALPAEMQEKIDRDLFGVFCAGPDIWFFLGFWGGKHKKLSGRGAVAHREKTGAFLTEMTRRCREAGDRDTAFSVLAGMLCHYALDGRCHPYVAAKTGNYDPEDPEQRYRGNHTRLERAIDSRVIRQQYHCAPWHFSFCRHVLRVKQLPESLRPVLDGVFETVYGWPDCYEALNRALRDQRLFYTLAQDPTGLLTPLLALADSGKGENYLPGLTYRNKELDPAELDYCNEQHNVWHNSQAPELASRESFWDLFDAAIGDGCALITACRAYVYGDGPLPTELIGNRSYETGLDCDDPRNALPGQFACIFE